MHFMRLYGLERAREEVKLVVGALVQLYTLAIVLDLGEHTMWTALECELDRFARFGLQILTCVSLHVAKNDTPASAIPVDRV